MNCFCNKTEQNGVGNSEMNQIYAIRCLISAYIIRNSVDEQCGAPVSEVALVGVDTEKVEDYVTVAERYGILVEV